MKYDPLEPGRPLKNGLHQPLKLNIFFRKDTDVNTN